MRPEPIGGPATWSLLEFEADLEHAEELSSASNVHSTTRFVAAPFRSDDEMFVVFAGRQFRYKLGDAAGKAAAETYARPVGVPESQLDWEQ